MVIKREKNIITVGTKNIDVDKVTSAALKQTIMTLEDYNNGLSNWQDTQWKQRRKPCPVLCPG